jgi:hypothetical protein
LVLILGEPPSFINLDFFQNPGTRGRCLVPFPAGDHAPNCTEKPLELTNEKLHNLVMNLRIREKEGPGENCIIANLKICRPLLRQGYWGDKMKVDQIGLHRRDTRN